MASIDWIILGLFAIALVGVILWTLKSKTKDTSDYFLAGRDATWIAIGASNSDPADRIWRNSRYGLVKLGGWADMMEIVRSTDVKYFNSAIIIAFVIGFYFYFW